MPETEEERRIRKEREREARKRTETDEERAARKAKEGGSKRPETDEERAARKERERRERAHETEDQRRERKAREAERDARQDVEKDRGGRQREPETEDQRRERKAAEARRSETEEERAARKERERKERSQETEEQRRERKAREAERGGRKTETDEERAARKERERRERANETEEQRRERKEREAERDREKRERDAKKEVVHKPLPQTHVQQSQQQQQPVKSKTEPVVQGRNPNLPPAQPVTGEPDDYDDDDFVDGFEVEQMLEAQKAVQAENAALKRNAASSASGAAGSLQPAGERNSPPPVVGQSRFGADDLQRQKYRAQFEKDMARATALRRLVDLDDVTAVIADIPPLSEYDMYIRNFGGTGRKQAGMQAPALEDKIDVEVQADRVTSKSKGAQCPEDLGLFPEKAAAMPIGSGDGDDNGTYSNKKSTVATVDATLLSSFLARVFPVMRTLLDEAHFGQGANVKKSSIPLSDTFTSFVTKETVGRPVQRIAFNPNAAQYVLCLHGPKVGHSNVPENRLPADRCDGLVVVWNINDQSMPDKILTHSCTLTAACYSPSKPHLVYGGASDGAVCIWDLRETDSMHASDDKKSTITLRSPSFTTEWQHENHPSPVAQMCVAGYNSMLGNRKDENDQLVTLDQSGNVYFWMVNDGTGGSGDTGGAGGAASKQLSDQDHGQLMGSCVRCFRAAVISVGRPAASLASSTLSYESSARATSTESIGNALDFDFCPADPSRFVVAAGATLHHMSRFSSIVAPSAYSPHSQFFGDAASAPSSCSFSALDSRILIGGYSDGTVRVYLRDEALPQLSVPVSSMPIRQVQASSSIKLITFALDDNGVFFVLDHGIDEKEVPVVHCSIGTSQTGKCTAFSVPCEDKGSSQLAFGFEDGSVQLHLLNDKWLAPSQARSERWL